MIHNLSDRFIIHLKENKEAISKRHHGGTQIFLRQPL